MATPGTKETVATLILGYAAPQRPEWHQRMVWMVAWLVAVLPFLRLISRCIEIYQLSYPGVFSRAASSTGGLLYAGLTVVEPCAAILVLIITLNCLYRRRVGAWDRIAFLSYLLLEAVQAVLQPMWYSTTPWFRFNGDDPPNLLEQLSTFALVAFPVLLLIVLNPLANVAERPFARRLFVLLILTCTAAAAATIHYWTFMPQPADNLILDFWRFLDGHAQPTAKCLGQLMLNVGILALILLLAQSLVTRRLSPTLLRAMTTLLCVGWCVRLLEGAAGRLFTLSGHTLWLTRSDYGGIHGFFAFPDPSEYRFSRPFDQILDGISFLCTALIALIFIICFRIAINRPEFKTRSG